jgi:hypothetical protein
VLSFVEALARSQEIHKKRHLLLGNGFSIACRPDCFNYKRILDEADLDVVPHNVVHPGLLEGWGCLDTQIKEDTG